MTRFKITRLPVKSRKLICLNPKSSATSNSKLIKFWIRNGLIRSFRDMLSWNFMKKLKMESLTKSHLFLTKYPGWRLKTKNLRILWLKILGLKVLCSTSRMFKVKLQRDKPRTSSYLIDSKHTEKANHKLKSRMMMIKMSRCEVNLSCRVSSFKSWHGTSSSYKSRGVTNKMNLKKMRWLCRTPSV
jgi:hypothetical protein